MTGTKSVIPLSDGLRLILAGGRVVYLKLEDNDTGEQLIERQTGSGESVFVGEDTTISLGLPNEPHPEEIPEVRDALKHFGFGNPSNGECTTLEDWWATEVSADLERSDWSVIAEALHERAEGMDLGDHIDRMQARELRGVAQRITEQVETSPPGDLIRGHSTDGEANGGEE